MARGKVKIELPSDVALVLFEWVERQADQDWVQLPDAHSGELGALGVLAGALESKLVEPFAADYGQLVEAARHRLADQYGIGPNGGE
ncbi:hypothetical protein [Blastococcus sp. URHD0036]|uniref:hypothetical protein n=1 Tax=Blastococcus sp. URHD0036 TaxID=1380356 RepID=UPI0004951D80|nr:hypothetical protein [Blastococcus sp. URHD0036]